jgi:hypothetical protein
MGPISCPETSVCNYHCSLRNNLEERSFHLIRGGSLKSQSNKDGFSYCKKFLKYCWNNFSSIMDAGICSHLTLVIMYS